MRTKFKWIFTLLIAFSMQFSFAQEKTVTGIVTDKLGPMPGANVVVKGTTNGTQTDFDGKYSIKAKVGDVIEVSFTGYNTKTVSVGASSTYNVVLDEGVALKEVVVIGYQSKDLGEIIGSVKSIKKSDLGDQKITTVSEALVGFTGVQVVNNSGQPGASPTIRLRGPASLNGNLDPLLILDGSEYRGNLNAINFDDLESYTVLKDADAAAIYGNRGARGVIVMTTKKGRNKEGKSQFNIGMSYGFSDKATNEYDYVSATQMMQLIWKAQRNSFVIGGIDPTTSGQLSSDTLLANTGGYNPFNVTNPIDANGNVVAGASLVYDTDWYDIITQQASRQDINLSLSGSSEKTRYYVSGSFLDSDGFMLQSKFKRMNGRVNLDTDVRDWLKIGANMNFANSNSNVPAQSGTTFANNLGFTRSVSNIYPLYTRDPNGNFILDSNGEKIYDWGDGVNGGGTRGFYSPANPVFTAVNNLNKYDRINMDVSPYVEIGLTKDLKLKSQYSYSFYLIGTNEYMDPRFGSGTASEGRSTKGRNTTETYTWFNTLNYDKTFYDKHNFSVMLGQELYNNEINQVTASATGFALPGMDELVNGALPATASSVSFQNRLYSYFARMDYNFDKKYFIGASYRRDASSRFIGDNKWGNFWSLAGGWNITNENFLKDSKNINLLKLRVSYGVLGNEDIGDSSQFLFPYFGANEVGWNIDTNSGVIPTRNANPDLGWEVHKKSNFGFDFGFFNNRLTGTIEVFNNKIEDLIYQRLTPASENGGLPTWVNSASMTNKGWELELNSVNVRNDNFSWNTSFSASTVRNNINTIETAQNAGLFRWEEGKDRYEFWMQEWAGVDPNNGLPLWYKDVLDVAGDPTGERVTTSNYAEAGRYYTGKSALPKIEGRFANMVKYKNFDLNVIFAYRFGNYIYNSDYSGLMHGFHGSNPGSQLHPDIYQAWEEVGDITDVPQISLDNDQSGSRSTRWIQKGDYFRLRTLSFGYAFDKEFLKKAELSSLRLYVTADNYFTWKKESRIDDPEQSYGGTTSNSSTLMKTISFGVNVSF